MRSPIFYDIFTWVPKCCTRILIFIVVMQEYVGIGNDISGTPVVGEDVKRFDYSSNL